MPDISNILFDFGNVILDIDIPGAGERLLQLKSPDLTDAEFEARATRLAHQFEVGKITTEEFVGQMLQLCTADTTDKQVVDAWNSMLVGIPRFRLGMLESLKTRYNVYMLSNTNDLHINWVHQHLAGHGIHRFERQFLHMAYYSHEIGQRKPDKAAYQHVIDETYLLPEKTLFIDDLPENIATARKLGFQTLHSPPGTEVAETLKVMSLY